MPLWSILWAKGQIFSNQHPIPVRTLLRQFVPLYTGCNDLVWLLFVPAIDHSSHSPLQCPAGRKHRIMPKREPRTPGSLTGLLMAESLFYPSPTLKKKFFCCWQAVKT